jgi:hypothetical protein
MRWQCTDFSFSVLFLKPRADTNDWALNFAEAGFVSQMSSLAITDPISLSVASNACKLLGRA